MDRLIGTLFNFSQMGWVETHQEGVDLGMLAQEVSGSLQLTESGRQVDFRIAEGVVANDEVRFSKHNGKVAQNPIRFSQVADKAVSDLAADFARCGIQVTREGENEAFIIRKAIPSHSAGIRAYCDAVHI